MKFDLHIHTIYSDGQAAPRDVIEKSKILNIGTSITDHNHVKGAIIASEIAINENLPFIIGCELGTREGKELLIYFKNQELAELFYKKEIEPFRTNRMTRIDRSMHELLIKGIRDEYDIFFTTLPHPFGPLYKNVFWDLRLSAKLINFADSIETINASMNKKANEKALFLGIKKKKMLTASTDAHLIKLIGKVTTEVNFDRKTTDISHNSYLDNFYTKILIMTQITKCNIYHSILKKGVSVV